MMIINWPDIKLEEVIADVGYFDKCKYAWL